METEIEWWSSKVTNKDKAAVSKTLERKIGCEKGKIQQRYLLQVTLNNSSQLLSDDFSGL